MKTLCPKFSVFSSLAIVVVFTISQNRADSQLPPNPSPSPTPSPAPTPPPALNGIDLYLIVPGINPRRNQFDDLLRVPVIQTESVRIQGCQADKKHDASSVFFVTGRGGLAPNPYEPLSRNHIWEDVPSPTQRSENYTVAPRASGSLALSPNKIREAQNWLINKKGEVVLVAESPIAPSQQGCRLY
jgi:hypothetical protein